ncbi:MAG TPA: GNAT family N-acetyltransferase [Acidobacteriaceae bacterium]|nr:GNAT family N-acetyltransferase [Acidobacteriaceae bacterium]
MLQLHPATPADVPQMLAYVRELAEYEREPESVVATEADLLRDGFGKNPRFGCVMAEWNGEPAGFALYFYNYSTWKGRSGIHVEDLFVRPAFRGLGIGKALLLRVAAIAHTEQCGRLQWDVLAWNEPAIAFYEKMGASMMTEWRIMRVDGGGLANLAALDLAAKDEDTK